MDDTSPVLSRNNAKTPPCLSPVDDIVELLRTVIATPHGVDIWTTTALQAADEIERLRKQIASLQVEKVIWREMCEEAQEQLQKALEHHYRLVD